MEKIKVLVVSDYWAARDGLCELLQKQKDLDCVGTAEDIEKTVELVKQLHPDVVLADVTTHKSYAVENTHQIKSACPTTAILLVSGDKDINHVRGCMQAGVNGYLLRDGGHDELMYAIRMVRFGKSVFSVGDVSRILYSLSADSDEGKVDLCLLRSREMQVLELAARGKSNKEISAELHISENTVGTHLAHIFRKLNVQSRTEAVVYALRQNWFTIDALG